MQGVNVSITKKKPYSVVLIAREICRAVTDDCVMDESPERPPCTKKNCGMIEIAEKAYADAKKRRGSRQGG
jgi:hypothetical protein